MSSATEGPRHTVDESKLGVTSVFQHTHEHAVIDHEADADEQVLVALGYKQEFKRDFSIWSCFSVSFSILGILPSVASTLSYNFGYIGPAGAIWGWIVASLLIQTVAFSMAELCSSMPTAGNAPGQLKPCKRHPVRLRLHMQVGSIMPLLCLLQKAGDRSQPGYVLEQRH